MTVKNDISRFVRRLDRLFLRSSSNKELKLLGEKAVAIIVNRVRQGYGAKGNDTNRFKLPKHSTVYRQLRKDYKNLLDGTTNVGKSNLTFSGQLMRSMGVRKIRRGSVVIGPSRKVRKKIFVGEKRLTNEKLAEYLANKGRPFNYLTKPELRQLRIFYRRLFGDLVRKSRI